MASSKTASPLDVATRAASFNVILQVLLRITSFVLNGFVLRFVHAELLGVVNLRLTLLYNTILFLSREPFRKAALTTTTTTRQWEYTFNLMWLPFPIGGVIAVLLSLLWVSPLLQQPDLPGGWVGVACFATSALIELCVEPLWVLAQLTQHISIKVIAEGFPQIFRCLFVAAGVVMYPQYGIVIFGLAQVLCSVGYLFVYFFYFSRVKDDHLPMNSLTEILPRKVSGKYQSADLLRLSGSFFKQSLLKQFLTDGERYIMTMLGLLTFAEQGIYDIINNLGSLVARFVFLPIEESFYVYFSSILVRGEKPEKQTKESIRSSGTVLSLLLKTVTLIALIIISFGFNYSQLALDIYGGSVLSHGIGPVLLKCYCFYVLFLAINGITECFMFAALSQDQVERYNRSMLLFSVIFLIAAVVLIQLFGSPGFIIANCVNMTTRIVYSGSFIRNFFKHSTLEPLTAAIPSLIVIISLLISWIITAISMSIFCCLFGVVYRLIHIMNGCGCLLIVSGIIVLFERDLIEFFISRLPVWMQGLLRRSKTD